MTPKGSRPVLRGLVGSNAHPATQLIDFVAVLFGYAISGERTLEAFYECLQPFAAGFMALFGREQLPARSTLSRFRGPPHPDGCGSLAHALSCSWACAPTGERTAGRRTC